MKTKPYTISFRYNWIGSIVECRKTFWLPRRPSVHRLISLADSLLGRGVACSYSVVSGNHAFDGIIPPSSWKILPLPSAHA